MRKRDIRPRRRAFTLASLLVFALIAIVSTPLLGTDAIDLPTASGEWMLPEDASLGRPASEPGLIEIRGAGELTFDPTAIKTLRPDIFVEDQFSVFDILIHLADNELIELEYVFDEEAQTHVVQTLNGLDGWWYDAHYEGGGFYKTVVRMDSFPVKDAMSIVLYLEDPDRLEAIHEHYREEVARRAAGEAEGTVVIPLVTLRTTAETFEFADVAVTAHDARPDVLQPGTITMLDVLLSLGEQGALDALGLEWRVTDDEIGVIDGYYVVSIASGDFALESAGSCVLTHQLGCATVEDFLSAQVCGTSHIHLTGDLEVLVAPEAVEWRWMCL